MKRVVISVIAMCAPLAAQSPSNPYARRIIWTPGILKSCPRTESTLRDTRPQFQESPGEVQP